MRRRISLTMVAMVAGALVLAGLGTLGLTTLDSVYQTQSQLVTEARQLSQGLQQEVTAGNPRHPLAVLRSAISVLKAPLGLEGEAVFALTPQGDPYNFLDPKAPLDLPGGLRPGDMDMAQLIISQSDSGHRGRLAWAAYLFSTKYPVARARRFDVVNLVVLLTRQAPTGITRATYWFGVAAALTLVISLVVANRLGYRIARPLADTEAVTRRIAEGDLNARAPVPEREGPELKSLARSVNQMADSLERARGAQQQFLMSVSHDLRTPLTSIRGFAEAIADGTAADLAHATGVITSESRRLERLVGDLLELAKLQSGAFSLRLGAVDAGRVAEEVASAFGPRASDLGLCLQVSTASPAAVLCEADPDRLGQVVANLTENALNYAASTVSVRVEAPTRNGDGPSVLVEDDGPGIAQAERSVVFERLFRSSSIAGRNLGGGSGLGLAIVKELVDAMGGTVRAEPAASGGTLMVVRLRPAPFKRLQPRPSETPFAAG
ncbi:MAG: ATP-binding protein [Acidimicrobiales bacterium]